MAGGVEGPGPDPEAVSALLGEDGGLLPAECVNGAEMGGVELAWIVTEGGTVPELDIVDCELSDALVPLLFCKECVAVRNEGDGGSEVKFACRGDEGAAEGGAVAAAANCCLS